MGSNSASCLSTHKIDADLQPVKPSKKDKMMEKKKAQQQQAAMREHPSKKGAGAGGKGKGGKGGSVLQGENKENGS